MRGGERFESVSFRRVREFSSPPNEGRVRLTKVLSLFHIENVVFSFSHKFPISFSTWVSIFIHHSVSIVLRDYLSMQISRRIQCSSCRSLKLIKRFDFSLKSKKGDC